MQITPGEFLFCIRIKVIITLCFVKVQINMGNENFFSLQLLREILLRA